ncbi:MAG: calcium/sodium antiporter [Rhodospirillaceae bacterium]
MIFEYVVYFLIGLVVLPLSADFMVRGAVALSERLQVPTLVIGLTVIAFGTSLPELVVSLNAALSGSEALAIGNVVGSNIANILLILGAASILSPIACERSKVLRDGMVMLGATLVGVALILYGEVVAWHGAIMLVLLAAFLINSYVQGKKSGNSAIADEVAEMEGLAGKPLWMILAATAGGLIGVFLGANLLVSGSVGLARIWGVPEEVIGLTMVAFGTSLPELAASIAAALKRQADLALGNVIGSNIFNVLGIMGTTALVVPLPVPEAVARFDVWVLLASALLLIPFALTERRISRSEGMVLLGVYGAYIALLFIRPAALFPLELAS